MVRRGNLTPPRSHPSWRRLYPRTAPDADRAGRRQSLALPNLSDTSSTCGISVRVFGGRCPLVKKSGPWPVQVPEGTLQVTGGRCFLPVDSPFALAPMARASQPLFGYGAAANRGDRALAVVCAGESGRDERVCQAPRTGLLRMKPTPRPQWQAGPLHALTMSPACAWILRMASAICSMSPREPSSMFWVNQTASLQSLSFCGQWFCSCHCLRRAAENSR